MFMCVCVYVCVCSEAKLHVTFVAKEILRVLCVLIKLMQHPNLKSTVSQGLCLIISFGHFHCTAHCQVN